MNIDTMKLEFMLRLIPKVTVYRKDMEMNFYKKDDVERVFDIYFNENEYYKINGYDEFYVSTRDIFRKLISIEMDIENGQSDVTIEEFNNKIFEIWIKSVWKYYGI
ncbi:hypothetical protein [Clostridium tertium]|uniref:hypothetical protein n=1 Tax=Clostridium tertium TaxID=1559 RepID=UPI000DCF6A25|nr:hypothetical protein [Clostridium tertium]